MLLDYLKCLLVLIKVAKFVAGHSSEEIGFGILNPGE
jgi:hypothetical protein